MVGLGNRTFFSGFKYLLHNINFFQGGFWRRGEHCQLVVVAVADVVGCDGDGYRVGFFFI